VPIDVLEREEDEAIAPTAAVGDPDAPPGASRGQLVVRVLIGFVLFLVLGNAAILGSTLFFRFATPAAAADAEGIDNVHHVDDKVIRGAAPSPTGLRDLADAGVTTVIDLRAEADLTSHDDLLAELGMKRFHLPIRDGQLPSEDQAAELLRIVDEAPGRVFLHCGAGVGRTGAMTAWYLNVTGQTEGVQALRHNLSVGPPSLEQIVFSLGTAQGEYQRPGVGITVLSRVLDGPRRIWHNVT
jgi:protein-tyrosine phosphatase